MKLSVDQEKIFSAYKNSTEYTGFHFRALEELTQFKRDEIRTICRQLAALGYLEFMRGCWTEDGEMYGSAYVITPAGRAALAKEGGE